MSGVRPKQLIPSNGFKLSKTLRFILGHPRSRGSDSPGILMGPRSVRLRAPTCLPAFCRKWLSPSPAALASAPSPPVLSTAATAFASPGAPPVAPPLRTCLIEPPLAPPREAWLRRARVVQKMEHQKMQRAHVLARDPTGPAQNQHELVSWFLV